MALENPEICKTDEGKQRRVSVHGIPTISGERGKTFSREVNHKSDLCGPDLLEAAIGRLDFQAQGIDMTRDFGVMMGEAFGPGAAIGSSSVMAMQGHGHEERTVTPEQIAVMLLRSSAAKPSTPAMVPIHDSVQPGMSPRSTRIGVMLDVSIVLMSQSVI